MWTYLNMCAASVSKGNTFPAVCCPILWGRFLVLWKPLLVCPCAVFRDVNPPCLQILRIDREGVIGDIIMHLTWRHLCQKYLLTLIVMNLQCLTWLFYFSQITLLQWHIYHTGVYEETFNVNRSRLTKLAFLSARAIPKETMLFVSNFAPSLGNFKLAKWQNFSPAKNCLGNQLLRSVS